MNQIIWNCQYILIINLCDFKDRDRVMKVIGQWKSLNLTLTICSFIAIFFHLEFAECLKKKQELHHVNNRKFSFVTKLAILWKSRNQEDMLKFIEKMQRQVFICNSKTVKATTLKLSYLLLIGKFWNFQIIDRKFFVSMLTILLWVGPTKMHRVPIN